MKRYINSAGAVIFSEAEISGGSWKEVPPAGEDVKQPAASKKKQGKEAVKDG